MTAAAGLSQSASPLSVRLAMPANCVVGVSLLSLLSPLLTLSSPFSFLSPKSEDYERHLLLRRLVENLVSIALAIC